MAESANKEAAGEAKDNVWQAVLAKATNKSREENSSLIVLGERNSGKAALLSKFKNREFNARAHDFLFNYSFLNVKNVHDEQDPDDIRAIMNVWETDNEQQAAGLLPKFMTSQSIGNCVYVITVDLSEPWDSIKNLTKWLGILKTAHDSVFNELPEDAQLELKTKISRNNQFFVDPSVQNEEKSIDNADIQVDLAQPAINLGVPLIIVGCKADLLNEVLKMQAGVGDRFEYLSQKLRTVALEYGAALAFTSSFGHGTMIEPLQEYIYHRVYGFDFVHSAKVIGNEEDYGLWVPSGYDTADLISSVTPANPSWKPDAEVHEVFRNHASNRKMVEKTEPEVKAEDNEVFFKSLLRQKDPKQLRISEKRSASSGMPKGHAKKPSMSEKRATVTATSTTTSASSSGGSVKGAKEKAVKDFFRSLLSNDKKGKPSQVRSNAKEALQSLKKDKN